MNGILIALAGLPGAGKSTIAKALAQEVDGVWLRIDSIEQALRQSMMFDGRVDDAGYVVAQALAADNLCVGRVVIGDCVNDLILTRDAWRDIGLRAGARVLEVEIICSDPVEHRRRVETRTIDVAGLIRPTWQQTIERDYHDWGNRKRLVVDTARQSLSACVQQIRSAVGLV